MTDQAVCSKCKEGDSQGIYPQAVMWYSVLCGHPLCNRCKEEMFTWRRMQKCPMEGCVATLRAQDFSSETPEARLFTQEKTVRSRLASIFTRTLEDFDGDTRSYDDYLEKVESYIATLVSGTQEEKAAVEEAIEKYKVQNKYVISHNPTRRLASATDTYELLAKEAEDREKNAAAARERERAVQRVSMAVRQQVLQSVLSSDSPDEKGPPKAEKDLYALRERLQRLIKSKEQGGTATVTPTSAKEGYIIPSIAYVPCANVPLPRFLRYLPPALDVAGVAGSEGSNAVQQLASRASGVTGEPFFSFDSMSKELNALLWT